MYRVILLGLNMFLWELLLFFYCGVGVTYRNQVVGLEAGALRIEDRFLVGLVLQDYHRITYKPIVLIINFPYPILVFSKLLHDTLCLRQLCKFGWLFHFGLEEANILPSIVIWILKHVACVFVFKMHLVSCFEVEYAQKITL